MKRLYVNNDEMFQVTLPNGLISHERISVGSSITLHHQVSGYFDADVCRILAKGNVTIFDVGANAGFFSMEVMQRTEGQAQVYCFEPIPDTFKIMELNFQQFNSKNVHLFNIGLGEAEQTMTFMYAWQLPTLSSRYCMFGADDKEMGLSMIYNEKLGGKFSQNFPNYLSYLPRFLNSALLSLIGSILRRKQRPIECKLSTLSNVIRDEKIEKIDLLKIDVEKAELDVLNGISDSDWQKINALVIEVHDIADRENTIRNLLRQHGFKRIQVEKEVAGQFVFNMLALRE